jgi:hypothetical protein
VVDGYLADGYAHEHLVGRYAASGDTLVDRFRPVHEETGGFAGDHEPVPDAEELKRRQRRARWGRNAVSGLPALPGRAFAAITVAPALLAIAWLLPGTGMLLAGRLQARPMVIIFVPLAVALCYFGIGRPPMSWPKFSEAEPEPAPGHGKRKATGPMLALLAMLVIAAGFGVWQAVFRSEQIFVTSDPGVYLQYGYWIAQHGTARIPESAAAFGGAPGLDFATPGFSVSGGSITPSFLPGLPLVLAAGTWLGGLNGALLMPAVIGACALLSFAGVVGRLCGVWWAVAGEIVLAVSLPEVYTSRSPFAEPLVQVLLFGGLCLFIDSLMVRRWVLAAVGGLALGLTVLVSIASLAVLLPAFPVLAALLVAKRPQAGPFGVGLGLGIGTGLVAGLALARVYLSTLSPQLHLIGLCAFGACAVTALTLTLAIPFVRAGVRWLFAYRLPVIGFKGEQSYLPSLGSVAQWLALVLPVLVLVGLAERPYLQTVRGQTDPAMIRAVAALQHAQGLAVDGLRQYYEESLHWVLWYLGAPALLLACAGVAALGRRSVEELLERRAPVSAGAAPDTASPASPDAAATAIAPAVPAAAAAPAPASADAAAVPASLVSLWGLPLLIVAWSVVTVLWDPAVVPWQPMASHRLVPVVLPGLVLFGIWMSSWLVSHASAFGATRAAVGFVGTCCVLALALPPLVTTLNPGLSKAANSSTASLASKLKSQVLLRGVGASATYGGEVAAASALCNAIGPSASVLVTDASTAATYAPVIRSLCGEPAALVVPGPSAAAGTAELAQAVRSVEQAGRRPVLLGPSRSSVSLPGGPPQVVSVSLQTPGDAESLTGAPTGTAPVTYSVWVAAPPGAGA